MYFILILVFSLGTIIGSFVVCYSWRFINSISQFEKRSFCDNCHHALTIIQLIPIWGFLLQKGHCYFCNSKISPLSTIFEILSGLAILYCYLNYSLYNCIILFLFIMWSFCLTLQDYKLYAVSSNCLFLGFIFFSLIYLVQFHFTFPFFTQFCLLLSILTIFFLKKKFGFADIIYTTSIYFVMGYKYMLWILLLSSILGIISFLITKKRKIPFLPFQSSAFIIVFLLTNL